MASQIRTSPVTDFRKGRRGVLMKTFDAIKSVGKNSALFRQSINKERVVVDIDMVLPSFQICQNNTCSSQYEVKLKKTEGGVLKMLWRCSNDHARSWTSSIVLCK